MSKYIVKYNHPRHSVVDTNIFGQPKLVRLEESFVAEYRGEKFEIEEGFVTDGASIPIWLVPICGSRFKYPRVIAAIVHDSLYGGSDPECSRAEADDLYRDLQIAMGIPRYAAYIEWVVLRAFGWTHWNSRKKLTMKKIVKDLAVLGFGAALIAMSGCQTTLDKTRNANVGGAIVDDGGFKAGTVEVQAVAQGETAILVDYSEDSSIFSPGAPMRHIKLTATGVDYVSAMPDILAHLCDAFKAAKEAKAQTEAE